MDFRSWRSSSKTFPKTSRCSWINHSTGLAGVGILVIVLRHACDPVTSISITRLHTTTADRTSSIHPSNLALFGAAPNAAGPWSSSRPSPPLRSGSVLLLRSSVAARNQFPQTASPDPSFGSIRPRAPCPRKKFLSLTHNLFQPQSAPSKATAADSDEAINFSSAVKSDTTLGLPED